MVQRRDVLKHGLAAAAAAPRETPPGIEENAIHLATVFTPGADPERRRAVLDVYEAWILSAGPYLLRSCEIPCVFPEPELPVIDPAGATRFYFQRAGAGCGGTGADLEDTTPDLAGRRIVHVYGGTAGR